MANATIGQNTNARQKARESKSCLPLQLPSVRRPYAPIFIRVSLLHTLDRQVPLWEWHYQTMPMSKKAQPYLQVPPKPRTQPSHGRHRCAFGYGLAEAGLESFLRLQSSQNPFVDRPAMVLGASNAFEKDRWHLRP